MITNKKELNKIQTVVSMSDICSAEHYVCNGDYKRVLNDISLDVQFGETVGITAKDNEQAKLLVEIMANVRPYYSGKCVLAETGMMRKKRIILPHLFYIDTPNMMYDNMTVLEFLMFATEKSKIPDIQRQKIIFDLLLNIGLDYISLSEIKFLTDEEKLIIELIVATFSESVLVVFNVIDYVFSESQIKTIQYLFNDIKKIGSIVISTEQPNLIGICCDKIGFLLNGSLVFFGTVDKLIKTYDRVLYTLTIKNAKEVAEKLQNLYSDYIYLAEKSYVYVYNFSDKKLKDKEFMNLLFENSIVPDYIKINKGRVENSLEELIRKYDL